MSMGHKKHLSAFPNFRYSSKCLAVIYRAQYENAMLYPRGTLIWPGKLCKHLELALAI